MRNAFRSWRTLIPAVLLAAAAAMPGPALAVSPALAATPAGASQPTATIEAVIGSCYLNGTTRPNTTFRITQRSAAGKVKSKTEVTSDGFGEFRRSCLAPTVAIGDKLELRLIDTRLAFKVLTIPALTLTTDRVHDTVRGTAKGVAQVVLGLSVCDPGRTFCSKSGGGASVPVNPGTHAFSWTAPEDTTGLSRVRLSWQKNGDIVSMDRDFANVTVRAGAAGVRVVGPRAGQTRSVSLRRGTAVATVTRRTNASATFTGTFKRNGSPMKVREGDKVTSTVAGDVSMTVPRMTMTFTGTGAEGRCFKSAPITIRLLGADGSYQGGGSTVTTPQGHWEIGASILLGWSVEILCANPDGDVVRLIKTTS